MTGAALAAVGRIAHTVPGEADSIRAPAWVLGLLAFGILLGLLFVTTRFNRDR